MTAIVQSQRYAGFWIRTAAYLIDAIALSLVGSLFGVIWVALDPRKQGWHDKIAGTVVVQTT